MPGNSCIVGLFYDPKMTQISQIGAADKCKKRAILSRFSLKFARFWCGKAFHIRTGRRTIQFREEYGFCSVLVVKGKCNLIVIKINRIDKSIN